jgi:ABC-type sugar transport system substrate-binding protein
MKKSIVVLLTLVLLLSLGACSQPAPTEGAEGEVEDDILIRVAWIFEEMTDGQSTGLEMTDALVEELNAQNDGYTYEKVGQFNAQNSNEKQIADIESAVQAGYDAIIISAIDADGCRSALEAAMAAGVYVIDYRGNIDPSSVNVSYDSNIDLNASDMTKEFVRKQLDADPDLVLNYGIIYNAQTLPTLHRRLNYVHELKEEMPDRINVVAEYYTNDAATSMNVMEDWLQAHPDINAVGCGSDEIAAGVINAARSAGRAGEFLVTAVDGSVQGIALIREGDLNMTVGVISKKTFPGVYTCAIERVKGNIGDGKYLLPGKIVMEVLAGTDNWMEYVDESGRIIEGYND